MDAREFLVKWFDNVEDALLFAGAPAECIKDLGSVGIEPEEVEAYGEVPAVTEEPHPYQANLDAMHDDR